jgi:hypothetical protein
VSHTLKRNRSIWVYLGGEYLFGRPTIGRSRSFFAATHTTNYYVAGVMMLLVLLPLFVLASMFDWLRFQDSGTTIT